MSSVAETIDVDVDVRTVYNQWTQFETFPEFMAGVDEVRQLDDVTTHWVTRFGGVKREFDAEITEQRPDERVAWKSTNGPTHAGVVTFHRLMTTTPESPPSSRSSPKARPRRSATRWACRPAGSSRI